ncbi:pentatricopeptide repeat-containing protein DOT4, chloroplastic [Amborella trichopoda]|uniref:pentatricopeptide repeat-containing protein DOT4, chloroplastic n=1 Tax=Amborella trichopoda TaxID=13333 RepID=UPI0005D44628|nr:pentatricopeptide repeat-containing protein DOT4, chloroplastic [Amborella trichopoda]|eukprot:XP_011629382.1 pentatricopeptide repeat-containing protein DOT4, chloroplastic [Amborella trichopoda]
MGTLHVSRAHLTCPSPCEKQQEKPIRTDAIFFKPTLHSHNSCPYLRPIRTHAVKHQESSSNAQQFSANINKEVLILCRDRKLREAMDFVDAPGLDLDTYSCLLQLCADCKSLSDGKRIHLKIASSGIKLDSTLGAKLVFMYLKCGDLNEGRRVFDGIAKENTFLWNMIMNKYTRIGNYMESFSMFQKMIVLGFKPDSFTFTRILKCCASMKSIRHGEQVHGYIIVTGFESFTTVGNSLISLYSKCGQTGAARLVFEEMSQRDIISWNSIIGCYISNNMTRKGIEAFREMQDCGFLPDPATLVTLIPACAELGCLVQGKQLHAYVFKSGSDREINVLNSLIDMYSKCDCFSYSMKVFDRMLQRTAVSWTSMIQGYGGQAQFQKAIEMFSEMETEGVKPDLFTITSIIHACSHGGSLDHGRAIDAYVKRNALDSDLFVANALIDMYAKCGSMADARRVFNGMNFKDIISWNAMIGGCTKNCLPNEALGLFAQMQHETRPNSITMACILPALAGLSAFERGREVHAYTIRTGAFSDKFVANALMDMYVKCGIMLYARSLFERMVERDLVSWTVMIAGYGMHGHGEHAIMLFTQMQEAGIKLDSVAFTAILYACSHAGLVMEGWKFFGAMMHDHGIVPEPQHYACMVDLLGRAGHLEDAYRFIKNMPMEPDSTIWGALLHACRVHRNVGLAEKVAEHVFELEPENTGYYVLLSNIYSEAEKWEGVKKIREKMSKRGLRKNPGCSWMEIKGRVHVFVSGDRSHREDMEMRMLMESLRLKMEAEGYVVKRRYALLLGEDEKAKGEALCEHSERFAIAFGLLKLPKGATIRVAKNLRVCGDCHEVAKFVSREMGREIVLRDPNRFHHFKDGRCSCRGYW